MMIKKIKLASIVTLLILFLPLFSDAQSRIRRDIELSGSSDLEKIPVKVEKTSSRLEMNIRSIIDSGELTIQIFDPNGEKQGTFSIASEIESGDHKSEKVNGSITKNVVSPIPGIWTVVIIPVNASSSIQMRIGQFTEEK